MENVGDCHLVNGWDKDFGEQALVLAMDPNPVQQRSCGPQCHGVSLEMSTTKHLLAGEGGKLSIADSAWELGVSSDPCQGARAGISKINTKFKIEKKERTGWQCPQAVCVCGGVCYRPIPKLLLVQGGGSPSKSRELMAPEHHQGISLRLPFAWSLNCCQQRP